MEQPIPTAAASKQKDVWDKLRIVAQLLIPIIVGLIGLLMNSTLKDREIRAEYVRLAIATLQTADSSAATQDVKKWAFNVLREMSPVRMPPELEAQALGLQIQRAAYRTGGGFGGDWGFVEVRATENLELFVYVDDQVRATTPSTLNLPTGRHKIEFRTSEGVTLGVTHVDVPEWPTQTITYSKAEQAILLGEVRGARMRAEVIKKREKQ